jgi:UDP-3-O-[3-hydroxymyristoyl] glucosamine N-acyltransferase
MYTFETILRTLDCDHETRGSARKGAVDFCSVFEQIPDGLTWVRSNSPNAHALVRSGAASVILCPRAGFPEQFADDKAFVLVDAPQLRFLRLMKRLSPRCERIEVGVHPTALVSSKAKLGRNVSIGPFAQLDDCEVGDDVVIRSHAIVHAGVRLGDRVLISEFVNVGGQGFSHIRNERGMLENMPHIGRVVIEDDVEIFPYSNVDRGTLGTTRIGKGSKIDHYCHIGHNATVGSDNVITANVTTAGGVVIGDQCMIGVGSRLRDSVRIGNQVTLGMSSTVTKDVPDGETWVGSPAMEIGLFRRLQQRSRE